MMTATAWAVRGLLATLVLAAACSRGSTAGPNPRPFASGTFLNATGDRVGLAMLTDSAGTVRLGVSVSQLAPGPHGLHFHAQGACSPPDFTSAGTHFNPGARKHGRLNPEGAHLGDLPNLLAGADGSADTSFTVARDLAGPGASSLLQPGGTALVIHAKADDERTDPGGNSGDRVACAVIEPG